MKRARVLVLVGLTVLMASAAPAAAASFPERLTLRLVDLGPGYVVLNEDGCGGVLAGEGVPSALTRLYNEQPHVGCTTELIELWSPPGSDPRPGRVLSAAFAFADANGASAELRYSRHVVAFVTGLQRESLVPMQIGVTFGEESLAFRTGEAVAVLWRSGSVMSIVMVDGPDSATAVQAAPELAAIQQQRVLAPTPLLPGDNDDTEVPLDNPRLGIDVRWLGKSLDPANGLPPISLRYAEGPVGRGEGPGWRARIDYGTEPFGGDVQIGLWRPKAWRRLGSSRFGQLIRKDRCTRVRRVPLSPGRARIYAGYVDPPARCSERRPDRFLATVGFRDVVVTVNLPICWTCREKGGPYNSLAGMHAVVRALRPRPPASEGQLG